MTSPEKVDVTEEDPAFEQDQRIIALEEQLAYMQVARDNALAMRDEAQARLKEHRKNAGRMVGGLRGVVLDLVLVCQDNGVAQRAIARMQEILDAGKEHP